MPDSKKTSEVTVAEDKSWYYEDKGSRIGPVDESVIKNKIKEEIIDDSTLVWKQGFTEWRKLSETELKSLLGIEPPPLSGKAVNNTFIWIFAFAPLLNWVLLALLLRLNLVQHPSVESGTMSEWITFYQSSSWQWLSFIAVFGLNCFLAFMDNREVKKAGYKAKKARFPIIFWGLFLVPVYFWLRAKYMKQKRTYFWTWIVTFVISLFLGGGILGFLLVLFH